MTSPTTNGSGDNLHIVPHTSGFTPPSTNGSNVSSISDGAQPTSPAQHSATDSDEEDDDDDDESDNNGAASVLKSLLKSLLLLRWPSKNKDGPYFFPRGSVEPIITQEMVDKVLREHKCQLMMTLKKKSITNDIIAKYAKKVVKLEYRKMFAILVILERPWEIVLFIKEKLRDEDLPLSEHIVEESSGRLVEMRRREFPDKPLDCCKNWTHRTHEQFDQQQWALIPPFFEKGKLRAACFYKLSKKAILPWEHEDSKVYQGGYASISRIKIHPSHHNFEDNTFSDNTFAVKHLTASKMYFSPFGSRVQDQSQASSGTGTTFSTNPEELEETFQREIDGLNRFSGDDHPHLISLLAAYSHGDEYCLLFRWAECDLKAFWVKTPPGSALDKSNLLWMIRQCHGLASGLQRIHCYQNTETRTEDNLDGRIFGRHGDIKPENILIFKDQKDPGHRGILVITDFGLTKFHHDNTKTYNSAKEVPATLTYQPPECDMADCMISRSFDIWSFGCVLLEFITWQLGGWVLVQEFVNDRKAFNILLFGWKTDHFYEIVRQGDEDGPKSKSVLVRVKTEIHQFVNKLHAHQDSSETIHELLDFIMADMLVVESVNLRQRALCTTVLKKLSDLLTRLEKDAYVVKATPRVMVKAGSPEAVEMPLNIKGIKMMQSKYNDLKEHDGKTRRIRDGDNPLSSVRRTQTK